MASLWAIDQHLDVLFTQNDRGNIIESSSGNIFIVRIGVLYTPSLDDGCLGGIMRMQIINIALENGIKVYECSLLSNPQNLLAADELSSPMPRKAYNGWALTAQSDMRTAWH